MADYRNGIIEAMGGMYACSAPKMNTHNLVLCQSSEGWSLHVPGSTDDEIANGASPYILAGEGEPTQSDYDDADAIVRSADSTGEYSDSERTC